MFIIFFTIYKQVILERQHVKCIFSFFFGQKKLFKQNNKKMYNKRWDFISLDLPRKKPKLKLFFFAFFTMNKQSKKGKNTQDISLIN